MEFALAKLWGAISLFVLQLGFAQLAFADVSRCKIIFAPGAVANSSYFLSEKEYFADYVKYFQAKGCATAIAQFQENGTIELRARMLRDQTRALIKSEGGGQAVILAHSQGALDARFAIKTLGLENVSAVIMIGAPNRGTPIADWAIKNREEGSTLYWLLREVGRYDLRYYYFFGEMTEAFLTKHEDLISAVPGVRYASARGKCVSHCSVYLRLLDWVSGQGGLGTSEGGDGIVPAPNQVFGDDLGEFDLDHISEVSLAPDKSLERLRLLEKVADYLGLNRK
jgi:pimeloyl-ACP methyl ester carboxylesterase